MNERIMVCVFINMTFFNDKIYFTVVLNFGLQSPRMRKISSYSYPNKCAEHSHNKMQSSRNRLLSSVHTNV